VAASEECFDFIVFSDVLEHVRDPREIDERAHLEAVIAHGAPPIPILRRILLGEA
jgi:2-polyprenyl-3-methyl-5-hydroxy-6-metoxy-1,4-benzoquinol methylase